MLIIKFLFIIKCIWYIFKNFFFQISGGSVPIAGVNASTVSAANPSVPTMQAVHPLPGSEYSVHTLQPQTLHTAPSYIFTQGYDIVGGTLQY